MRPNADHLAVVRDEEGNFRILAGRAGAHEVLVLSQADALEVALQLTRKLRKAEGQTVVPGPAGAPPVTLFGLRDGQVVVGHPDGGAKHYLARSQAERAAAKLGPAYEAWKPAWARSYYVRLKSAGPL